MPARPLYVQPQALRPAAGRQSRHRGAVDYLASEAGPDAALGFIDDFEAAWLHISTHRQQDRRESDGTLGDPA
jgi:hypothetical protein